MSLAAAYPNTRAMADRGLKFAIPVAILLAVVTALALGGLAVLTWLAVSADAGAARRVQDTYVGLAFVLIVIASAAWVGVLEGVSFLERRQLARRGLTPGAVLLAARLLEIDRALATASVSVSASSDPALAAMWRTARDRQSARLADLFSAVEGLDGTPTAVLGRQVVARLADRTERLASDVSRLASVIGDGSVLARFESDAARAEARAVLGEFVSAG
jgi:hypothetical protein